MPLEAHMNFTPAESAILAWFAEHSRDESLRAQISAARAGERETTSIGFLTQLLLPPEFDLPENAADESQLALEGCGLFAPELDPFADCLLHTRGGRIVSLEVHAVAEGHPLSVSSFEVREVRSNAVDLR